ncbi:hypothetical protein N9D88_02815 [Alphaproteobacteria bacterium]|nr:hypothetical protein [Alphaproteobacteria bacterium]
MLENYSYTSFEGIILLLIMIIAGKAFRENWKKQGKQWVMKSWLYGILSGISFLIIVVFKLTF